MKKEEKKEEIKQVRRSARRERERKSTLVSWVPRTQLGRDVKQGKIKNINEIFEKNLKILEPQIVDFLIPELDSDLLRIGQAKGKFGGGKRRPWRQTQKKTSEGNVPSFACMAVVGDKKGYVGLGHGKAKETVPSKQKALAKAKVNLIRVRRGCGSFECVCNEPHSIPFVTEGKSGSSRIKLMPAPKGTGLVIDDECKKILRLAGIKDVYSKTFGQTKTKFNLAKACMIALEKLGGYI
ncbi:MAG: 30S ribosomal protein S5 [Candidatus Pacearchaeota archaeon]|nr:MAG: 30S ribosomal protein S5 [Candidatus Pacearchaeota archaeon]